MKQPMMDDVGWASGSVKSYRSAVSAI